MLDDTKILEDIRYLNNIIFKLQMEIDKMYAVLTSTTIKTREVDVQSSGAADPMADMVIQRMELEEELKKLVVKKNKYDLEIIRCASEMNHSMGNVMILRYVYGHNVRDICNKMHIKKSRVYRLLRDGEENFLKKYSKIR